MSAITSIQQSGLMCAVIRGLWSWVYLFSRKVRFDYCDFQSYKELGERTGVLILYLDRLRTSMCEVYKIINEIGPVYLQKLFTEKKTGYESRAAVPVAVPKFRTIKSGKRSLRYEGACLWNCLDNRAKVSTTLKEFKTHISLWEWQSCNYDSCILCELKVLWIVNGKI